MRERHEPKSPSSASFRDELTTSKNNDPIIPNTYRIRKQPKTSTKPLERTTMPLKPTEHIYYHVKITNIDTKIWDNHLEPFLRQHK